MNLWWGIGLLFTAMTGFALLVFGSFFSGRVKHRVPFYWFRSIFDITEMQKPAISGFLIANT
ncbi:hypothetical protein [Serratia plymuthica]|uniref:Uncharacterized protein n=1 Tax=Serratia plymuthica TaxID=82996 RepID=A0A7T2SPK3_SERPL|nr:hypothetical protein [Serratia plymuthica]QPS19307.1 hypothetical protein I6G64_17160 [Serratia plymuthica]QPS61018.1 hypothetical protein I6G52_12955 [Serratia plymuthica]UNK29074.1 hypothetical protein MNO11_04795 [Serratia plymuthica]